MKKFFMAVTLLLTTQAMANCPQLEGEYIQCKYTKHFEGGVDSTDEVNDDIQTQAITIVHENYVPSPEIYNVREILREGTFHPGEEYLNPFDTVVIGETRNIRSESEIETIEIQFTASCSDNALVYDVDFSIESDYLDPLESGKSVVKVTHKKVGDKLIRTEFATAKETGKVESDKVLECQLKK